MRASSPAGHVAPRHAAIRESPAFSFMHLLRFPIRPLTGALAFLLAHLAADVRAQNPQITTYSSSGTASYTVPSNATSVAVKVWGAGGYGDSTHNGGGGGYVGGTFAAQPGDVLYVRVGAVGSNVTSVRWMRGTTQLGLAIAGGGGSAGGSEFDGLPGAGGAGGGASGQAGSTGESSGSAGGGATSTAGGAGGSQGGGNGGGPNTTGQVDNGGAGGYEEGAEYNAYGGDGGAGYYGGGGGGGDGRSSEGPIGSHGGGGGSGYISGATSTTNTAGNGRTPPNTSDTHYVAGRGYGSNGSAPGSGLVVILTSLATTPEITSSLTSTGTRGTAFSYSITATNSPTSYTLTGTLPPGVSFNATTGVASGTPTLAGTFNVNITATNGSGSDTEAVLITIGEPNGPVITTQPQPAALSAGATANFTVTAAGAAPLAYQWLKDGVEVVGATNASFSITSVQVANVGYYAVRVSNSVGVVLSDAVPLTVGSGPAPVITSAGTVTSSLGVAFTYTITATNSPVSYNVAGNLPPGVTLNATSGVISGTPTASGIYNVTVGALNGGGVGTAPLGITVVAEAQPAIVAQPVPQQIAVGTTATFSVAATGAPTLTYQWRKDGSNITGATNATYTLSNAQTTHAGNYDVVIGNAYGSVTSDRVPLAVAPIIATVTPGFGQNYTVPSGAATLVVKIWGGGGDAGTSSNGGAGDAIVARYTTWPGQVLNIASASGGAPGQASTNPSDPRGGQGGTAARVTLTNGANSSTVWAGGGGGGGSRVDAHGGQAEQPGQGPGAGAAAVGGTPGAGGSGENDAENNRDGAAGSVNHLGGNGGSTDDGGSFPGGGGGAGWAGGGGAGSGSAAGGTGGGGGGGGGSSGIVNVGSPTTPFFASIIKSSDGVAAANATDPSYPGNGYGRGGRPGAAAGGAYVVIQVFGAGTAPSVLSSGTEHLTVGYPVSYRILGSNGPVSFAATNLPPGLSLDPGTGLVTGTPTTSGVYSSSITIANYAGAGSGALTWRVAASVADATIDTTAPTTPTTLAQASVAANHVALTWTGSTDNFGVVGYRVYRGATLVGTTSNTRFIDSGLTASTAYSYTVRAFDAAGNVSPASTALNVTTTANPALADADGDGIPDRLEVPSILGTNPSSAAQNDSANTLQLKTHRP